MTITSLKDSFITIDHTVQEKSEMIDKTPWSHDFNWEEIKDLAKHMQTYKAREGIAICREGAVEAYMCLIVEGCIKIMKENLGRDTKTITSLSAGSVIGEMSLIDGSPRSASAIASQDTIFLVLTKDTFVRLLDESPRLSVKLLLKIAKSLSQRLRQTSGILVDYLEK